MALSRQSSQARSGLSRQGGEDDLPAADSGDCRILKPQGRTIVIGSEGQDGRLLFDQLASEGCAVLGIGKESTRCTGPTETLSLDIEDRKSVAEVVDQWKPSAVFYLAAVHQSSQGASESDELAVLESSFAVNVGGAANFLHALKLHEKCAFFYAASSMIYGDPEAQPQNEETPFRPTTAYGITKTAGIHVCQYYRRQHGVRASTGILFNHESPLRQAGFVSQRIARGAVAIARGTEQQLELGNLSARVDWGYAPDYIDAMIRIAAQPEGDDYVVATGETHSVGEFAEIAFARAGLNWREHVVEDASLLTRSQSERVGDSSKLRSRTGWRPRTSFAEMVGILVDAAQDGYDH